MPCGARSPRTAAPTKPCVDGSRACFDLPKSTSRPWRPHGLKPVSELPLFLPLLTFTAHARLLLSCLCSSVLGDLLDKPRDPASAPEVTRLHEHISRLILEGATRPQTGIADLSAGIDPLSAFLRPLRLVLRWGPTTRHSTTSRHASLPRARGCIISGRHLRMSQHRKRSRWAIWCGVAGAGSGRRAPCKTGRRRWTITWRTTLLGSLQERWRRSRLLTTWKQPFSLHQCYPQLATFRVAHNVPGGCHRLPSPVYRYTELRNHCLGHLSNNRCYPCLERYMQCFEKKFLCGINLRLGKMPVLPSAGAQRDASLGSTGYPLWFRQRVQEFISAGGSVDQAAAKFDCDARTVRRWLQLYNTTGSHLGERPGVLTDAMQLSLSSNTSPLTLTRQK
jgi:hypothetical protein